MTTALPVEFSGHPCQGASYRDVVGHRQALGIQPSLPGQLRAVVSQPLCRFIRGSLRLERAAHVQRGPRHLERFDRQGRHLKRTPGLPHHDHEGAAWCKQGGSLAQGTLGRGRTVEADDDRTRVRHGRTLPCWAD